MSFRPGKESERSVADCFIYHDSSLHAEIPAPFGHGTGRDKPCPYNVAVFSIELNLA
jgi:hypothetical protein